jgi:hypothetical protein
MNTKDFLESKEYTKQLLTERTIDYDIISQMISRRTNVIKPSTGIHTSSLMISWLESNFNIISELDLTKGYTKIGINEYDKSLYIVDMKKEELYVLPLEAFIKNGTKWKIDMERFVSLEEPTYL